MRGYVGVSEAIRAMDLYVSCESPEAKAKAEKRWERNQAEAVRILAEAKGARYQKPERPPVERKPSSHCLLGGLFLTFGGDR